MQKAKALGLNEGPLIGRLQEGQMVLFKGKEVKPDMVSFVKKGKKIGIVLDTTPCEGAQLIAEDKDLLICEASYASAIEEKAEDNKHLTAKQAALIASHANVKRLILTHISQRYKTPEEVLEDAKDVFPSAEVAYDFMKVKI